MMLAAPPNHLALILVDTAVCLILALALVALLWERAHMREAEAKRREVEDRLALAIESAGLGVWAWDARRDVLWMDHRARRMHGIGREAATDRALFLASVHADDRPGVEAALGRLVPASPALVADYRTVSPDGRIIHLVTRGRACFDSSGRMERLTGVAIDITERHAAGLELQQRRTELAHATRAVTVSQLTGSLAHELNQPLAAILANAHAGTKFLRCESPDLVEMRDVLADIAADASRAGRIIQRQRTLLRKNGIERERVELHLLISETVDLLRTDFILKGVSLQWRVVPGAVVLGDRVQFQQVLVNLLLNAADAMAGQPPLGRIVRLQTGVAADGGAWVSVEDHGPGVPPERFAILFEPFHSTKPHGLGMGLSICRAIMDLHEGSISLAPNHPGRGLTATLRFPPAFST